MLLKFCAEQQASVIEENVRVMNVNEMYGLLGFHNYEFIFFEFGCEVDGRAMVELHFGQLK